MTNDNVSVDPGALWRSQPAGPGVLGLKELKQRAGRYRARKQQEAILSVGLGLMMIIGLVIVAVTGFTDIPREMAAVAAAALSAGVIGELVKRHRRGTSRLQWISAAEPAAPCLDFYRRGLQAKRRALIASSDLYFAVVAYVVLVLRGPAGLPWYFYALIAVCVAALVIVRIRESRRVGRELEALQQLPSNEQ